MNTFSCCPRADSFSHSKRSGVGARVLRIAARVAGSGAVRRSRCASLRRIKAVARPTSAMRTINPKKSARFHSHRLSDTIMYAAAPSRVAMPASQAMVFIRRPPRPRR